MNLLSLSMTDYSKMQRNKFAIPDFKSIYLSASLLLLIPCKKKFQTYGSINHYVSFSFFATIKSIIFNFSFWVLMYLAGGTYRRKALGLEYNLS